MTDVLVVNHGLHHVCGVHDIGVRLHDAIPDSISKAYVEANSADELDRAADEHRPRVVLVNYRPDLMPWVASRQIVMASAPLMVAVAHNYDPHTLASLHSRHAAARFDLTLALEPQLFDLSGVMWSGRPLPPPMRRERISRDPMIGSFGFAFGHKRFDLVAREIVALDRQADYRLHCPTAHFGGDEAHTGAVLGSVRAALEGSEVNLIATTEHGPAHMVVDALAICDVNCLFYDPGQSDAGLSSALDYLLAAGRPILVSEASMFRHALPAAVTWPQHTLTDVLEHADQHAVTVRERADQLSAGYAAGIKRLLEMA